MSPIRTLVCAIDFSADSQQALRAALAIAQRGPVHVVALHVIELVLAHASAIAHGDDRLRAESATALRLFVESEWKRAGVDATFSVEVRIGVPEREILACARDCGADLIVTGTRGLGGVTKLFFGSVAEKVLRRADVPVMTVPSSGFGAAASMTRVLAAIDLDDTSERTAAEAFGIARRLELPLGLVHALAPLFTGWRWIDSVEASMPLRIRRARARLEDIARALDPAIDVDVRVGSPPEQVATAAREVAGTLLVVGLDGGAPLGRMGSTAYRIVCLAETPVLAVPVVTGDQAAGDERQEAGDRRQETGDRKQETEDRRQPAS
jgi:nucleotide-binding universal stress UspA family protein